ncbi:MAG: ABC transporter substrate-binding protein [Gallionellaceae bacterium]|jgi:ABC-type transport system substrate-binding protein
MKRLFLITLLFLLVSCESGIWNNPYPADSANQSIYYSAFTERPKHLDPVQAYSENEYVFLAQIYQPPLQYHYLKRPYTLVPQSASAMPVVRYFDKNGRQLSENAAPEQVAISEYEIILRPDLMFQPHPALAKDATGNLRYMALTNSDLAEIEALTDFKYSGTRGVQPIDYIYQIKRLAHPDLHSPIFGVMAEYIVGLKEYAETLKQARKAQPEGWLDLNAFPLSGVELVDAYTFRIKVLGKYPQFAYWLAMPFFSPMAWEAERFYAQAGMRERNLTLDWWPLGSGPYYLSENNPNQRMVLTKNPNFNGEFYPSEGEAGDLEAGLLLDAGKPLPLIDRVVFSLEKETIPYWNKFLQGYYDASGISSDSFDQAVQVSVGGEANVTEDMQEQGITLSTSVATSTMYMGFNWLDPVVGGGSESARKLRRAIAIAMDFEEFISIFANGRGIAAQSPIPPGIFGYREGETGINHYVYDWENNSPKRKSIEVAKQLLGEAGYPNGLNAKTKQPLVIYLDTTANGVGGKSRLDWLRKQFDKLNIQLVVRSTDYNRFQDKIRRGDTQMFYYGWNADYPDPENFLFLLHGEQGKVANGGENAANYLNPEFDSLFQQMKNMPNGDARQAIIDDMLEILHRDSPWLWGHHPKDYVLRHHWLKNSKPNKMANNNLKYLRIDAAERDTLRKQWNQPLLWPLIISGLALIALLWWLRRVMRRREEAK